MPGGTNRTMADRKRKEAQEAQARQEQREKSRAESEVRELETQAHFARRFKKLMDTGAPRFDSAPSLKFDPVGGESDRADQARAHLRRKGKFQELEASTPNAKSKKRFMNGGAVMSGRGVRDTKMS